jgi:diketogulonate reductase-like aldo/keto reductase
MEGCEEGDCGKMLDEGAPTVAHGAEKRGREGEEEGATPAVATTPGNPKSSSLNKKKRSLHGCTNPYAPANAPPHVREQAFINLCTRSVRESCSESVTTLRTGYVDVLMLHWPAIGGRPVKDPLNVVLRNHVLLEMVKLTKLSVTTPSQLPRSGDVVRAAAESSPKAEEEMNSLASYRGSPARFVAVSNFQIRHLEAFRQFYSETAGKTEGGAEDQPQNHDELHPIHIHQFEFHPLCRQRSLLRYCILHGISVQQYSPLGSAGVGVAQLLSLPCVVVAAQELSTFFVKKTEANDGLNDDDSRYELASSALTSATSKLANTPSTCTTSTPQQSDVTGTYIITPAQVCILWGYWYFDKEYTNNNSTRHFPPGEQTYTSILPPHSTLPRSQTPSRILENFEASKMWNIIKKGREGSSDDCKSIEAVFVRLEVSLLETRKQLQEEKKKNKALVSPEDQPQQEEQPMFPSIEASEPGEDEADLGGDTYDIHYCWESSNVM